MKPAYAEGCRAEARLRDGGRADRVVDPAKVIKSYVATAKERRNLGSDSQKRSRISVTLDAEGFALRDGERVRIGVAMPLTNVAKEIYELAMSDGHDTEDFSAVYEYLSSDSDIATIDQKSPALAKAQLHQN
jgi:3-hydroxyisobutyrate dehydrogenase-like beta-hydroxyacid dehydrogenase